MAMGMKTKTYKLSCHKDRDTESKSCKNQDIILSPKEFPDIKAGDVVEVCHVDEPLTCLLLQVKQLPEETKDVVSIEQGIANLFSLRLVKDVMVTKVDPESVSLDLVELLYREQYYGRSDMWRLCKALKNTCVHLKKQIECVEMRTTVHELWAKGKQVRCGYITEDTRIVFRSSTAVVNIFIQLSAEMWHFDLHGDLYFEKAVNGFLTDLFDKWKEQNCLHDVTIVLFTRVFYEAQSLDEFPPSVKECVLTDELGRIYEDFYRVIVQNERYDEWKSFLRQLRSLFYQYQDTVLHYHDRGQQGWKMPKGYISAAADGNVLETLNMSLNLFENYYLDRNFDRTGKVSVVITPGPGVFQVDCKLANITEQRTIECGVGSDLVCMGEQPLHAAPLFKFYNKIGCKPKPDSIGDDYNIPHWMNHSFYMSKNQLEDHKNSSFVPSIKPPSDLLKELDEKLKCGKISDLAPTLKDAGDENLPVTDYDEYDAQVFKLPSGAMPRSMSIRGSGDTNSLNRGRNSLPRTIYEAKMRHRPRTHNFSEELSMHSSEIKQSGQESTAAITIPSNRGTLDELVPSLNENHGSCKSYESDDISSHQVTDGSAGSPMGQSQVSTNGCPSHISINPFAPSKLQFKMTSNRRRWVHAFPVDQRGLAMQARHVHSVPHDEADAHSRTDKDMGPKTVISLGSRSSNRSTPIASVDSDITDHHSQGTVDMLADFPPPRPELPNLTHTKKNQVDANAPPYSAQPEPKAAGGMKAKQGISGNGVKSFGSDDVWSPDMSTAVDWKSLTIPAALPITTDYFPDLDLFLVCDYPLVPDEASDDRWSLSSKPSSHDKAMAIYKRPPLTLMEVFKELISQRLGQGFQIISRVNRQMVKSKKTPKKTPRSTLGIITPRKNKDKIYLSSGHVYHKVSVKNKSIRVKRFWPIHQEQQLHYNYHYRFQAPDSNSYDVSWTNFSNKKLENYKWNHLDQYICTQGDCDYPLTDSMKYWRARFFLLPQINSATKKIIDKETQRCDIYEEKSPTELQQLIKGFIRFLETMNKVKKTKPKPDTASANVVSSAGEPGDASPRKTEHAELEEQLNVTSSSIQIAEELASPTKGLTQVQGNPGLPMNTFVAAEAVYWCIENVVGVQTILEAVDLMQKLMSDHVVLHCSGNNEHKFIFGYYLYYIPQRLLMKPGQSQEASQYPTTHLNMVDAKYNYLFQNEWCEVAILQTLHPEQTEDTAAVDLCDGQKANFPINISRKRSDSMLEPKIDDWRDLTGAKRKDGWCSPSGFATVNELYKANLLHKFVNVEVDPNKKSDRREFAVARYHAYYNPKCAFELQIQWMVATGPILRDLVQSYARRANLYGFHLMPVPCDPFALPYTENSDPLRGPIFVPLDMQAFGPNIFEGCTTEQRQEMLYIIQDVIIKRFGFMPVSVKVPEKPGMSPSDENCENCNHQYVHCTAGMFVLIPESHTSSVPLPNPLSTSSATSPQLVCETPNSTIKKSPAELHKIYIARQGRPEAAPNEVGFLWSWNYMSSKRWRSQNTGDETFQDTVLSDFRRFCSNHENRLTQFWEDFQNMLN